MVLFMFALSSCGSPSADDVRKNFLKHYPTAEIVDIGPGEGDGSAVYMHIKYKLPGSTDIHEDVWQYLNTGGQKWSLNHKEKIYK